FNTEDNNRKNKDSNQDKDSNKDKDSDQNKDNDNSKVLLYNLNKVYKITLKLFEGAKGSNELVKFVFEIKLDEDLINTVILTQQDLVNTNNLK
ncbi:8996_t:CDS:1, partial [Racocetra fulgida]